MNKASLFSTVIIPNGEFTADLMLALATLKMAGFRGKVIRRDCQEVKEADRQNLKTILLNVGQEINATRGNYDFSHSRRTGVALAVLEEFTDTTNEPIARELAHDLYYRVNQVQIGQAVPGLDCLDFTRIVANFNNVDKGFMYAMSLTQAILVSHVATLRKQMSQTKPNMIYELEGFSRHAKK